MLDKREIKYASTSFSKCKKYRWLLHRRINRSKKEIIFIGLNPSVADKTKNDHTLNRIKVYCKNWGYGDLKVINLFAIISTNSKLIKTFVDPIGKQNDRIINDTLNYWSNNKNCDLWIGWGAKGKFMNRNRAILNRINKFTILRNNNLKIKSNTFIIGLTKEGDPRHPLYTSKDASLKAYKI
tara:strand:- start:99 stop:644 length:546 start_codon:yes stop_codon:yes gene_type:complete